MTRARRFVRNVSWILLGQGGVMVVNFFALPFLLRGFGAEAYGVYLLMYTVGGYLGLFQFGAGLATIKYVSEARAAGEDGALKDALKHSALIHFGGVGAAALVLWCVAPWLSRSVFEVPVYFRAHALWLLRGAAVGGVFAAGAQWAFASFQGFQRFGWPSALSFAQAVLMPAGLLAILGVGRGLGAAGVWYVAVQALIFAVAALALRSAMSDHRGSKGRLAFEPFARYGFSFFPAAASSVASTQIDKSFVAALLSLSDLTLYAVPSGLLQRLQTLPSAVSHALMPVLSESSRVDHPDELKRLYLRSARALFAISAPPLALLFALMPQLLQLWLGPAFSERAAAPARLLVAAQAFAVATHAPAALAGGLGGGRLASAVSWAQALTSLALWSVLVPRWGILGAAAGALGAQAVPALVYVHEAHDRFLKLSWERFAREVLWPIALPTLVLLCCAWAGRPLAWTWPGFLSVCAVSSAAYAALAWRTLPPSDTAVILKRLVE